MGGRDQVSIEWGYSAEAEQAVLGAILLDNAAIDRIGDICRADDFYTADHRSIFTTARALIDSGKAADLITIASKLNADGTTPKILGYMGELVASTPSADNVTHYAAIVADKARLRRLYAAANDVLGACLTGGDVRSIIDKAQQRVLSVTEAHAGPRSGGSLPDILRAVIDDVESRYDARAQAAKQGVPYSEVTGTPTGFRDLDEKTTGMQPGQLWIVAARPAMGKSAFSLKLARNAAAAAQKPALFISLEMSVRELALRLLSAEARVHVQRIATGRIYEPPHAQRNEWDSLTHAIGKLVDLPLILEERAGMTANEMRSLARRHFRESGGLSCIVVDYLQLMASERPDHNRTNEIGEISRALKNLARELQIPVVALSQLNRGLEQRQNKRPVMSDLRDSGAIEQDADVILFIYRDEVYNPDSQDKGRAEIIVSKQRNGPTGMIPLAFRGEYTDFSDFEG
jgi:replicative DNA helicase